MVGADLLDKGCGWCPSLLGGVGDGQGGGTVLAGEAVDQNGGRWIRECGVDEGRQGLEMTTEKGEFVFVVGFQKAEAAGADVEECRVRCCTGRCFAVDYVCEPGGLTESDLSGTEPHPGDHFDGVVHLTGLRELVE